MIQLRPYQAEAIDSLFDWFNNQSGNPLVVVPTGGGKSVILAEFARSALEVDPATRIIVATHVRELIAQNHSTMLRLWPEAPAGIYSAGIGRREHDAQILFAGIQSVYQRAEDVGFADLLVVDEAHLIPRAGMGMYRTFVDSLLSMNPLLKVIGLTATPFRTDSGRLDEGEDRLFSGVAYDCDLNSLIEAGWLAPVVSRGTKASIDTSGVHTRAGEFVADELQAAAMQGDTVKRAAAELAQRAEGRKAILAFCCGIEHANDVAAELRLLGIDTATIFGDTPKDERDDTIRAFKRGELRCICNVGVLTTGFDAPNVDLIALLRPTKSPGLYVQMVGRGLRTAPGKTDCLVLDFGGNVMRHGPIDQVRPTKPGTGTGEAPVKECTDCSLLVPTATKVCPECGYVFPSYVFPERLIHGDTPDEQRNILAGRHPTGGIERWDVNHVAYAEHRKPDKPVSLRVTYSSGYTRHVSEWVCFEHAGYARTKAEQWWLTHGGRHPVPDTVDDARFRIECGEILSPSLLVVDVRGKWPEIKGCVLSKRERDREPGDDDDEVSIPTCSQVDKDDSPPF